MKPYTAAVRAKGWTMVSFARELGLTPRQLDRIANAPKRVHWLALAGLPSKSILPANKVWFSKGDRVVINSDQLPDNSILYPERENGVVSREPSGRSKYIYVLRDGQTADEQFHPTLWRLAGLPDRTLNNC